MERNIGRVAHPLSPPSVHNAPDICYGILCEVYECTQRLDSLMKHWFVHSRYSVYHSFYSFSL